MSKTKIEKRWVEKEISSGFDIWCESIENWIDQLADIKREYEEKGFKEIVIRFSDMYGDGMEPGFYAKRLETNKEFEQRIKREERDSQKRKEERTKKEEGDRKEWERLKKKYGDE